MEARTERLLRALGNREAYAVVAALLDQQQSTSRLTETTKLGRQTLEQTLEVLSQASVGVAGRDYSLNQLSYEFAFQNNNVNTAAAISVELLLAGLVAAALFVVRSGFFDAD